MPDVFSSSKRSDVMSRIRGRGNKDTELFLVRLLREHGIKGWRRHLALRIDTASMPAGTRSTGRVTPDFVFRKPRLAVFVDGCFWHACPKHSTMPASNRAFWEKKLTGNVARDRLVTRLLRRAGWRVLRVWEHDLTPRRAPAVVRRIVRALGTG